MARHKPPDSREEVKEILESRDNKVLYDAELMRMREEIGEWIQDERERNNYTQRELAETTRLSS